MVEQPDILLNERDTVLFGRLKDRHVVLATTGGSDVLDAGTGSAVDVVSKGKLRAMLASN